MDINELRKKKIRSNRYYQVWHTAWSIYWIVAFIIDTDHDKVQLIFALLGCVMLLIEEWGIDKFKTMPDYMLRDLFDKKKK